MKVIFVAGIHGVGKTTGCMAVAEELGIPYYTASQIIKGEKASAVVEQSKLVADIDENQRLLIQGVSKLIKGGRFLLDGHFTIQRESDGGIQAVPVDIFRQLRIEGIVTYTDAPSKIAKRMQLRDGVLPSVGLLQAHQEAEIAHAKHVAAVLSVPLVVLQAFDTDGMKQAIISEWI
ncbi:AAA family ATPase [Nitrosospira lacus]|uniref:Adenylate kinase n=1 Tax=Nitrosospira lacus TaxID=1288494 RepID=A0A1W6SSG6_9PROT|nr:ATP-binding protein [Nitrosospira lacus]ARO88760.1 AAA family ATPase [Nitrosospira lacus]